MKQNKKHLIAYSLGIFLIFLIWFLVSIIIQNDYVLPNISLTIKALGSLLITKSTYKILGLSVLRLLLCLTISFILAIILALLTIKLPILKSFLSPSLGLIKTMPIVVLIILLLVIFNSNIAVYVISSFVMFPILYEGILLGFNSIPEDLLDDLKTISGFNKEIAKKIYIPLSLPYIFTSLLQSFGLGLKVSVMAEFISQPNNSIGHELMMYKNYYYQMEYVLAWSIILIIIVLLVDLIIKKIQNKIAIN